MMSRRDFKKKKMRAPKYPKNNLHPALHLHDTLRGHTDRILKMALSPDGRILATPSRDKTVRLWNLENGRILQILKHREKVVSVAWSPDGTTLASGGSSTAVCLWDVSTGQQIRIIGKHRGGVTSIAWSPDGKLLASSSNDATIGLWDIEKGQKLCDLTGHSAPVVDVVWSPSGGFLCSGSADNTVRLWSMATHKQFRILRGHNGFVNNVSWSSDGEYIAFGSDDRTVHIWNPKGKDPTYVLEGHTDPVINVSFLNNGHFLTSLDTAGALIIWSTSTWEKILHISKIGNSFYGATVATHPTIPVMAALSSDFKKVNIWNLDFSLLQETKSDATTVHHVNAKVVLLGDSGVGKSGLGIRMAYGEFRPSEGSTHGAQFWHFPTERLSVLPDNVQSELTLWDLAGQPEYRLIHRLFLDDMDVALLLFDCSDSNDPFHGVHYWAKVLKKHAPEHTKKFLISSRCDVSPVTVELTEINKILAKYDLHKYFLTSALTGIGIEQLFRQLLSDIAWDHLPRTSTPELFHIIREFLLERKAAGQALIVMGDIFSAARKRFTQRSPSRAEMDTVIQLLQSQGFVYRLDPKPELTLVMLKPELINQYGSSIILAARNHPRGIGAVSERDVLVGNLPFSGFERLPPSKESLILEATIELFIRHDLCFREMGYLVFPSQINVTRTPPAKAHPRTEVAYRFSGSIETIYASLVVRLSYTEYFRRENQWRYAVEFSRNGHNLGFSMQQVEDGTGELEIYFYPGISDSDRVTFIRFVTDHLRVKGIDIHEEIRLYCPKCSNEVTNREAIEARVISGNLDIPCQYCDTKIMIPKSIEECYLRDPSLDDRQQQLVNTVETRTQVEVQQFQTDQKQYAQGEGPQIHILHLSDLHLENETQAQVYRTQLETDLTYELGIHRLDYLVISGDITNHSTEEEYGSAFKMLDGLVAHFGLDPSRIIIVPGNHDVNWDASESSYPFVSKRKLPTMDLPPGRYIQAGDAGVLLRNDSMYLKRFAQFNDHFYKKIYPSQDYPLNYKDQAVLVERTEDRILFLGLNSSWEVDHHFPNRTSINMPALTLAIDRIRSGKYAGWLKIAVWHHPVTGKEMMNNDFMELLAVNGFQLCLHGHIHEAIENSYKYDERRSIHILGAGTFSASPKSQVTGIPLQYNLLTLDPRIGEMNVQTRKKEKSNGAWSADARWNDRNHPKSWFNFQVQNYGQSS